MINDNTGVRLIFGLKLRTLRQESGMNYKDLSKATGMAVSYLHDIENGKKYPKADKIILLSKALKVDYDFLVSLTGQKRLQPFVEFMSSDFISTVPWEHFGITPSSLLSLFSNMPDKVTAFMSAVLKRSQSLQLSTENFYTEALRSYQDLHDNYFEDLEKAVSRFQEKAKLKDKLPLTAAILEDSLLKLYKIKVDRKGLIGIKPLKSIRSYYAPKKKTLFINENLSDSQEKFLIGRELAFHFLKLKPRPYETIVQSLSSFEIILHNFKASYFSNALLMPEDKIIQDLQLVFGKSRWSGTDWVNIISKYNVTPESLMQRLTNISQLHNPYTNTKEEHYCRRWVAINTMAEVRKRIAAKKTREPLVRVQISKYWKTHNNYFCITFVKPQSNDPDKFVSVTVGLLIDSKVSQKIPFLNHPSTPVKVVHTTCERCGIMDCKERAAKPTVIEHLDKVDLINKTLKELNKV
jgi:hypothetical protein